MKHLINDRQAIVTEALDAAVLASGGLLARLDGYPEIKVAVLADWDRSKVALISGGGSGHEPAHVGFIGRGMLTAAVCGEIFASPSVDAVFAAILAVTGPAGCLLIVKNYTGDRLNFGLAAEKARALGLDVELVIVGDDVATAGDKPRGIAGTVLVHKCAGHTAEQGLPLAEVKAAAQKAATGVASLGLSLTTCNVPGSPDDNRIGENEIELGLGIHGEPGLQKLPVAPAASLVAATLEKLLPRLPGSAPIAVLINNLGGLPPIELAVVTRSLLNSPLAGRIELLVGPAPLMTALDMKGFSLSVLELDEALRAALVAPTEAPAWPGANRLSPLKTVLMDSRLTDPAPAPSDDPRVRKILSAMCEELLAKEAALNALDAKVGDGDTGSTFAGPAKSLLASLDSLPLADPPALCRTISARLQKGMGGSSGVLLAIFSAAAGDALAGGASWPAALQKGLERMQAYGGAKVGDRTMIDALAPAIAELQAGKSLTEVAQAAEAGAKSTESIAKTHSGRSAYLTAENLLGVRDPGAAAVAFVLARLGQSA